MTDIGSHWLAAPILLPLAAGVVLMLLRQRPGLQSVVSVAATLLLAAVAVALLSRSTSGEIAVYLLGNWRAPFGIALALDRLSALMVLLTALIGIVGVLAAQREASSTSEGGSAHFQALMQFQLAGVNGAFLTADLFNLFVFFEVLLIASYGLLLHGGGAERVRAAVHYVVFNLVGSAIFLVAIALLYAAVGTLNMADLALRMATLSAEQATLVRAAAWLLFIVFGVKAALFPLYFWLPGTYRAATPAVAAVFAILTKVGVYGIARATTLIFGPHAGPVAGTGLDVVLVLAAVTLALAVTGALAAERLRVLASFLAIGSTGMLLLAVAIGGVQAIGAAVFYVVPSTVASAALFLLIGLLAVARGDADDRIDKSPIAARAVLGIAFFAVMLDSVGLPPLGGFIGKALLLSASLDASAMWVWAIVLPASLGLLIAASRAGSSIFWASTTLPTPRRPIALAPERAALAILFLTTGAVTIGAGKVERFADATARQLVDPTSYINAVLHASPRTRTTMTDAR